MDKQSASRLLDETFNSDFEINRFIRFVKELFNNFTVRQKECTKFIASQYKEYIASFDKIGDYKNARKAIEVLVVQLNKTSSRDRARTMQRNFIANWLEKMQKNAALVAFYGDDPQDWRFSFVKMEYQLTKEEDGKVSIVKELTPARRYSFLVGVNEPNHTCRRQFLELVRQEDVNPTLEEIEEAFSIDNVTKEFFLNYKELYLGLKESLGKVIENDPYVKREFEEKDISTIDFAKKLLGQIVFIYFLQKKGWLGVGKEETGRFKSWGTGPKNFLRKLFDKEIVSYDNFFNDVLEPLFYEALATERDDDYYSRFNCKIPFLNGGLFEPINDYDWVGTEIVLSNSVFEKILTTFDQYNFTVKEDEPLEKEVAIDPEMLGKVFENLLDIKDRKSTGRYYTPREIVHYMCQQSLINYLETNTPISIPRDAIEKFIQLGDVALDLTIRAQEQKRQYHGKTFKIDESLAIPKPIEDNYKEIDRLLKDIKIVDPAVGSGAFPIGMMNEIVKARSILTLFFDEDEQRKRTVYKFKREAIENSLYGVDIDSSAVDIAKLRFWLSLIVDEEDIKIIKPLPNLDHKIMCGNSLLKEFEGVKLFDEKLLVEIPKDYSYQLEQIDREVNELNQELHDIYTGKEADNGRTKQIQRELKNLKREKEQILFSPNEDVPQVTLDESFQKRIKESQKKLKELTDLLKKLVNEQNRKLKRQYTEEIDTIEWELIEETLKEEGNEEAMQKLQQYKKNKSKPFFLWKLYFSEIFQRDNPGFDVVIANPPYISYYSNTVSTLTEQERDSIVRNFKSVSKRNDRINSMNLFAEKGLELLRNSGSLSFIVNKTLAVLPSYKYVRQFILSNSMFNYITTDLDPFEAVVDCMVFGVQKINKKEYNIKLYSGQLRDCSLIPVTFFEKNRYLEFHFSKNQPIIDKIERMKGKLDDAITINRGVNIGGCFKEFLAKEKMPNYYKYLAGTRSIKKYYYKWDKKYDSFVIFDQDKEKELRRAGKTLVLGDPQRYNQDRLFLPESGQEIMAAYSSEKIYSAYGIMVGTKKSKDYDLKFICALLNSKLITFYCIEKEILRKGNKATPHVGVKGLKSIPIPLMDNSKQKPFIQLVDQILSITKDDDYLDNPDKQAKVKKLEEEIDKLVYELYELTPEEIEIVEALNKEK